MRCDAKSPRGAKGAAHRFSRVHATQPLVEETGAVQLFAYLGDLDVSEVAVELYAEGAHVDAAPTIVQMRAVEPLVGAEDGFRFEAVLGPDRPLEDFSARLRLHHRLVTPLETPHIAWVGPCQPAASGCACRPGDTGSAC